MARINVNPIVSVSGLVAVCMLLVTTTAFLMRVSTTLDKTVEKQEAMAPAIDKNTEWRIRDEARKELLDELGER